VASTLEALLLAMSNFQLNRPQFSIYQGTGQTFTTGVFAAVTFDSSTVDSYNGHSNSVNNSRYTAQVAGTYLISGGIGWVANGTGGRGGSIYKNGSSPTGASSIVQATTAPAGTITVVAFPAVLVQLNVGDYVEMWGFQASGGNLATTGGGQFCSYTTGWLMHL
jgi:hypothetical protein